MTTLKLDLTEWDTRLVIEALKELETKWETISRTSLDEDEQAEYGNDLMILTDSKEKITKAATLVFGKSIAAYDRTPYASRSDHLGERTGNDTLMLPVQPGSPQVTSEFVKQLAAELD